MDRQATENEARQDLKQDLLSDSLGLLVPHLSLSVRHGHCPTFPGCGHWIGYCRYPVEWCLDGTSDQLGRSWPRWPSLDVAKAELIEAGYTVSEAPINLAGDYLVSHPPTLAAQRREEEEDRAKWAGATPCYVRYGRLPRSGRSRNYADGTLEAGVSVFRGERLASGEARARPGTNYELGSLLSLRDRPLYIIAGREIGLGSDGEPLLAGARIVSGRLEGGRILDAEGRAMIWPLAPPASSISEVSGWAGKKGG